ncbi:RadC family protein, partial [Alteromonas sp. a30]|uniref:RadC family protein n=1 Tax=Alteromonas sp. a30 TaxID=2730917 RepID=UPI003FA3C7F2
ATEESTMTISANTTQTLYVRDPNGAYQELSFDEVIDAATLMLNTKFKRGIAINHAGDVKQHLKVKLAPLEHEVFYALWLDNQNRIITEDVLFRGTINSASVFPREVVKTALRHNAAGVILAHNHPSGIAEPSNSDEYITKRLIDALYLVEVKVLDHIIVGEEVVSFAQRGLI